MENICPDESTHLILHKEHFMEIMNEAKNLIDLANKPENNLMHSQSLDLYNYWAKYLLSNYPKEVYESPGFKIAFLQLMSVQIVIRRCLEDWATAAKNEARFGKRIVREPEVDMTNIVNFQEFKIVTPKNVMMKMFVKK